jgi:hypothetical protein
MYLGKDNLKINDRILIIDNSLDLSYPNPSIQYIIEDIPVSSAQLFNYVGILDQEYEPGKQYSILESYLVNLHKD